MTASFHEKTQPEGCQCDPREWAGWLDVCDHYLPEYEPDDTEYCRNCQHRKACHADTGSINDVFRMLDLPPIEAPELILTPVILPQTKDET